MPVASDQSPPCVTVHNAISSGMARHSQDRRADDLTTRLSRSGELGMTTPSGSHPSHRIEVVGVDLNGVEDGSVCGASPDEEQDSGMPTSIIVLAFFDDPSMEVT